MSSARSSVRQHFWIKDLETGTIMRTHAMPETYSDSKSPTWSNTNIIGRSSPIKGYSHSESRKITFVFNFHSSVEQDDPTTPQDVYEACQFLISLAYPDYDGGIKPPHAVLISLGPLTMRGVVSNVQATYKGPWDINTGHPYNASVSVTVDEADYIPKSYSEIRV